MLASPAILDHPIIDRQHRRIETLGRALRKAIIAGKPCQGPLTLLLNASRRHFASEERLMERYAYPDMAGHRSLHDGVIGEILRMRAQLANGVPLHRKHAAQILDWLAHHSDAADRNLVGFLARLSADRASAASAARRRRSAG